MRAAIVCAGHLRKSMATFKHTGRCLGLPRQVDHRHGRQWLRAGIRGPNLQAEEAVLAAVGLALEAGAPTKNHILNLLHRLVDWKPTDTPTIKAPSSLTLTTEPRADVERYDERPRMSL